jgi:hypothetical protein
MQVGDQLLFGLQYIGSMSSANVILNYVLENNILCNMSSFLATDEQDGAVGAL